jgi:hypothetical protein
MNFQELYNRADAAGNKAVEELHVEPMIVYSTTSIFSNEVDTNQPIYRVDDGPCGFASVIIKPANSAFSKWLRSEKIADKRYGSPGISIWISQFNQSYAKKSAYAAAFAKVLCEENVNARPQSSMD